MNLEEYQQIQPHVKAHGLIWLVPNTHCAWRVDSLMEKEPDTVAWIEKMGEGDVLFDVGANIGQYAMLAAKRGVFVHAFEPESQNFALLCRNVAVNELNKNLRVWPIALADQPGLHTFYVQSLIPGNSCNTLGQKTDYNLKPKDNWGFEQGCGAMTLDFFADTFGPPTHIKLDVDGLEHKVLLGAIRHMKNVKSVLVETNYNLPEHQIFDLYMQEHGLFPDEETAERAKRTEGAFKDIGNRIYYRK